MYYFHKVKNNRELVKNVFLSTKWSNFKWFSLFLYVPRYFMFRYSCWTVEIFKINGPDFHAERSIFSWRTVQIFMLNGRDFHDEWLRFSWWTVQIFMMNGPDFHDERSRFSRWQVMKGRDFHNDRSRIALLLWFKSRSGRGASGHLVIHVLALSY